MVGSAVDTIVWSSAASSMPSMTVPKTRLIWRRVRAGGWGASTAAVCAMPPPTTGFR